MTSTQGGPAGWKKTELRYRKLVDNLPNCLVHILDETLTVVFAGGSLVERSNFRPDMQVGQHVRDIMPPAVFEEAEPHLRTALGGQDARFDLRFTLGALFHVCATPVVEEDGAIHEILVIAVEVSALQQAEVAEQAVQERLHLAVQAGNVGLWDWDLRTNRVRFSTEWKQQIGYTDAEIGDSFDEWERRLHPDDRHQARDLALAYVASPGSAFIQEFRLRHKDGSYRWILAQGALAYDETGRPKRMLGSHIDITEKKRNEEAMAQAAQFAQATLDGLTAHIAIVAGDGTILAVNQAWREFAVANAVDAAAVCEGANYLDAVEAAAQSGSAEAQQWLRAMQTILDGKAAAAAVEYPCHSPDESRWFIGRITRFVGQGPAQLVVAHEEITERKLGELALRQSEAALKRSQAMAHVGHWTWDTRTNTVAWSDEMKRIFGLDPATFAGDLMAIIEHAIHPEDVARVQAMNVAVLEQQQPAETEYRVVWPDGSSHHVRAIPGDRLLDADGRILQLSGVVQDVTERKLRDLEREQMLRRLQDQAEQLAQVMRSVPDGVLLLDEEGRVLLSNPRAEEMLWQLAAYDDQQRLLRLGDRPLESYLTSLPAGQWHTVSAGKQIYEIAARPVESGPVATGLVLVMRNVTAARAVQEQLQRQERLAAVGQLAAGIAHDFNNIMSVISIYAELTNEAPGLNEPERARTRTIMDQAQRATRLIRQILDFSRQSVFERHTLDLLPLLKEEIKLLKQTLPENIEIRLLYTPGEYLVLADPTRIQQLVMNLALNARDAMPEGGALCLEVAHLTVDSSHKAPLLGMEAGNWLRLSVSDSGSGIASDHMAHIFEPFFTTKDPGKGTGLGLAQAHGIAAQHDGQITVASEVGAGTVFTIYLPALVPAGSLGAAVGQRLELPQGHDECVLLVEDDADLRASMVDLLTTWRYQVVAAANGEEALALLAQRTKAVDVILSDVVMPRLGGVALVKTLRAGGVRTPVVLMTGHTAQHERVSLQEADVVAWLDKPPSSVYLSHALAAALALR